MGSLVEGQWVTGDFPTDEKGRFVRPDTTFHDRVSADPASPHPAEANRYHLYVSWACPWAHRSLITRALKGLDEVISISVVDPFMGEGGWEFSDAPGTIPDPINRASFLRDVYLAAKPDYTGRVTVPVLWDKKTGSIVNNESREIMRILDKEFDALAQNDVDLCPPNLQQKVDATIDAIYEPINNGVYRCGFASTQAAHEEAVQELFDALERWEHNLDQHRFLCGSRMTEADICMFTTLLRFDLVYYTHFKCNIRRIRDFPNLWGLVRDIYQTPGVAETCNINHIKQHYFRSHESINPRRIVPLGPVIDFEQPHDRATRFG